MEQTFKDTMNAIGEKLNDSCANYLLLGTKNDSGDSDTSLLWNSSPAVMAQLLHEAMKVRPELKAAVELAVDMNNGKTIVEAMSSYMHDDEKFKSLIQSFQNRQQ